MATSSKSAPKSAGAFKTISEVASELDLPQHVLRFWETKFNAIKPMKRGGGRRYYRPDDVVLLKRIRDLLYNDGYTIKGVHKLLRDGGTAAVQDINEPEGTPPTTAPNEPPNQAEFQSIMAELEEIQALLRPQH